MLLVSTSVTAPRVALPITTARYRFLRDGYPLRTVFEYDPKRVSYLKNLSHFLLHMSST